MKKKWSDFKVDAKNRITLHRKNVCATGGGRGEPELTPLDEKMTGIIGESLLNGVVTEAEGDSDVGPQDTEDSGK